MYLIFCTMPNFHLNGSESALGPSRVKFVRPNSCDNSYLAILPYKLYFFYAVD